MILTIIIFLFCYFILLFFNLVIFIYYIPLIIKYHQHVGHKAVKVQLLDYN